jgi:hypothetical protein
MSEQQKLEPVVEAAIARRRTFSLVPDTLSDAMRMAEMIAKSDFAPKDYVNKPGNVLVAIQMGLDIGLKPMQALQNIAVINGRPSIWGDAALALVQNSDLIEYVKETFEGKKGTDDWTAVCEVKRKGWPDAIVRKFSVGDAKKAGLWTKAGTWQTYPDRMLQMRARSFALRDAAADCLMGLVLVEEAQDYAPAIEGTVVSVEAVPDVFNKIPEPMRDNVEKAFAMLDLPRGLRLTKLNEFLGSADVDPELGAKALLDWCRDEYAARQGRERVKGPQNSKVQAPVVSTPTPAATSTAPAATTGGDPSRGDSGDRAAGPEASTVAPAGVTAPLKATDIQFGF